MVQTSAGVKNSEWMQFIKECSVIYHARKKAAAAEKSAKASKPPEQVGDEKDMESVETAKLDEAARAS